jgi:hypothetical protein
LIPRGPGASLIKEIYNSTHAFPLANNDLEAPASGYLCSKGHISDSNDLDTMLSYITPKVVVKLPGVTREALCHYFLSQLTSRGTPIEDREKQRISILAIFKRLEKLQASNLS